MFRYTDNNNFLTFRFSGTTSADKGYEILKWENGTKYTVASKVLFDFSTTKYYEMAVDITGNTLTAYIDGNVVFSNLNIGTNTKGSVGLRVYAGTILADDVIVSSCTDGATLSNVSLTGTELSATLSNLTSDTKSVMVVGAIYENINGMLRLHSVNKQNVTLSGYAKSSFNISLNIPQTSGGYTVKIFIIDSLSNIKPVGVCVDKTM